MAEFLGPRYDRMMPGSIGALARTLECNFAPTNERIDVLEKREFAQRIAWLHDVFSPRAAEIVAERDRALLRSRADVLPSVALSRETPTLWRADIPAWCRDARSLLCVPADDARRALIAFESGASAVVLDLEDSVVDRWQQTSVALANVRLALEGQLAHAELHTGRQRRASLPAFTAVRIRGLQAAQYGIVPDATLPAPLYELASIMYGIDHSRLRHPLCVVIPKAESVDEALWWRDLFEALAGSLGLPSGYIRCIVLADSLQLAFSLDEFVAALRGHCIGIAFGRRGYTASVIRYFYHDSAWILPDLSALDTRDSLFARMLERIVNVAHASGLLALGAATTSLPGARDQAALTALADEKSGDALAGCDGAFVVHPAQVDATMLAFATPAAGGTVALQTFSPTLAPPSGPRTLAGSATAARAIVEAQFGMLGGRGAVRLDDELVDHTTERIYSLMLAQRTRHGYAATVRDSSEPPRVHDANFVGELFDRVLNDRLDALPQNTPVHVYRRYREARMRAEALVATEAL